MAKYRFTIALISLICALTAIPLYAQQTFTDSAGVTYRVEKFLDANFPVGMVFTEDGRLFYTEKTTGNVRLVHADGTRQIEPVIHLPTDSLQERGMLGIALDPDYEANGYIWVYHTAQATTRDYPTNKIIRFHEDNGVGSDPQELLAVPIETGNLLHNGGNLHFDSEGYLYVGIGDYGESTYSQNLDAPQGKIHRFQMDDDQLIVPDDNPFEGNSVFAYGFRNPFDFAIDPVSGRPFATENGLNCDDELDLVLGGFNYGWSETYECSGLDRPSGVSRYMAPLLSFTPTIAPTGIAFYTHPDVPEWENDLFFCGWNDGVMRHVRLNAGRNAVETVEDVDLGGVQCRIDVAMSPDGAIYFGSVGEEGGAIYRLVPAISH